MKPALGAVLILVAFVFAGCSKNSKPAAPVLSSGAWLAGRITSAGSGIRGTVAVYKTGAGGTVEAASTEVPEGGYYALPLPPGRYLVGATVQSVNAQPIYLGADGPALDPALAETLEVPETAVDTLRADFAFGAISVTLHLPHAFDGQFQEVEADWIRPDGTLDRVRDSLEGSALVKSDELSCTLDAIPAGNYLVWFLEGPVENLWSPGVTDPRAADTIRVRSVGSVTDYQAVVKGELAWIQGRLPGSWQLWTGANLWIAAFSSDSAQVGSAVSDAEGFFTAAIFGTDRVRLHVRAPNGSCWLGGPTFALATEYNLTPGDTTQVQNWDEGGVSMRLMYDGIPEPVQATLRLVDAAGNSTSTDELVGGDLLTISLLHPGAYSLQISPLIPGSEFFVGQWYDGAGRIEDATPIQVAGQGAVRDITLHLVRGGELRGRFLDSQGQNADGSLVVTPADQRTPWCVVDWLSNDPEYRIVGVPDGTYKLGGSGRFVMASYTPDMPVQWHGNTADWDSATVITVQNHEIVAGLDVRLR